MNKKKFTWKFYHENIEAQNGGIISQNFLHYISFLLNKIFIRTKITPNQITILSMVVGLTGAFLLSTGIHLYLIIAAILIQLAYSLDCCDGDIARYKKLHSRRGSWLDFVSDEIKNSFFILGLSMGIFAQTKQISAFFFGIIAMMSIYLTFTVIEGTTKRLEAGSLGGMHNTFWIVKKLRKLGFKQRFLSLTTDVDLFVISLAAIFNRLWWALFYFVILKNLYWITFSLVVWFKQSD